VQIAASAMRTLIFLAAIGLIRGSLSSDANP
jgi:hypothetical protein